MNINFVFTDWSSMDARAKAGSGYPPTRMYAHKIPLMSFRETEAWVNERIAIITRLENSPEEEPPLCESHDLWQDPPKYKYYKTLEAARSGGRSTKNFNTNAEAQQHWIQKGQEGIVVEVPGQVKGCNYCAASGICSQRDALIKSGALKF
jgi:hypothetical protein